MPETIVTSAVMADAFKYKNDCAKEGFRDFSADGGRFDTVYNTYVKMHTYQCVEFVRKKHIQWMKFNHGEFTIMEALELLDDFVDEADPDVDFPNSVHAYQTAEGLRREHPDKDWLHLCGLVHDLGKVMGVWGEEQYSTVGDTFVVGAEFPSSIVYRDSTFNKNPDLHDPRYNTKFGMYELNCGLKNVLISWGHDEYMYQVLKHNKCTLPEEAMYCIRFHSFYPWHTGGDYDHLCSDEDRAMMEWIKLFNKHDLYTKCPDMPEVETIKPYYQSLVDKYMPGKLKF
uniref:Inositol oxygenase n=1 Tax=Ciona savignyi TaxID=51511 RepID=H2Z0E1_CIOSA